jgi:hypothetical protein
MLGGPQQTGAAMIPFLLLLLMQIVALGLILATAMRHPSWHAHVLAGVALCACLGAGYQVILQRITPVTLLCILGLDVLLMARLRSVAVRAKPPERF